ncbi:MAG: 3-hydroxyacyl-ACP dehydratase FabZ [Candidatus Omnitrophota bacterium]
MKQQLTFQEIKKIIPYDFPFLLIDKAIEIEKDKRAVCLKNVTGNEVYFLGHFKDQAVMPGVLIIEAIGQAALILVKHGRKNSVKYLLAAVNKVRFFKPVLPGDQMIIEVKAIKKLGNLFLISGSVTVDDTVVAKGELVFSKIIR